MLSYFRFYFRFQHLGVLPSFTCHLHIFDFSPAPNSISIHPADGMIAESPPQLDQSVQKNPAGSPRIRTNPNERLERWVKIHLESAALPSSDQRCNYSPNPWTCKSGFASIGDDHIGHLATLYPAILMRPVSGKVPVADPGESLTARIWVSKEYRKSSGEDFCFNPVRSFDSNPRKSWCIHLYKIL